jgi:diguanylate cyclase (GGDEF)-like protein
MVLKQKFVYRGCRMLHTLLQMNFVTLIAILCMLVFMYTNRMFDSSVVRNFYGALLLLLVLIVVDSVEYWTSLFSYPTLLRIFMSALGYSIRPMIVYSILVIFSRNRNYKWKVLRIPVVLNTLVAFSALFTGIAYSYSQENVFVRGPLGYTAYFTGGFYLVLLLRETVALYRDDRRISSREKGLLVVVLGSAMVIAEILESLGGYEGLLDGTCALAIIYYYFYLCSWQFRRDPLTGALNRGCFELDGTKKSKDLTAVIALDMNNLKQINDRRGHCEGDKAICEAVNELRSCLRKGCQLYRIGGDEFVILCFKCSGENVQDMIVDIQDRMAGKLYACAMGAAYVKDGLTFQEVFEFADQNMYRNKRKMKLVE